MSIVFWRGCRGGAGGVAANRIAAWDGNTWQPFGSGMTGTVYSLTVYNGELITGKFILRDYYCL